MRLPAAVIDALQAGDVDLNDPAVTIQLLKLNAVVGVMGKVVGANDNLATVGITCALCHSTVDDSFAPGIGKTSRWLGEHDAQSRSDHRVVSGHHGQGPISQLGTWQIRPALPYFRRHERDRDQPRRFRL